MDDDIIAGSTKRESNTVYDKNNHQQVNNKRIVLIVIAFVLIIGGAAGYWFGYRPYSIRKNCTNFAANFVDQGNIQDLPGSINTGNYGNVYQFCLNAKGL